MYNTSTIKCLQAFAEEEWNIPKTKNPEDSGDLPNMLHPNPRTQ